MKYNKIIKVFVKSLFTGLILGCIPKMAMGETIRVFYNLATPQHAFAAGDIKTALEAKNYTVGLKDLATLTDNCTGKKVVIALASNARVTAMLTAQGGSTATSLGEQAYALRTTANPQMSYWALGGDDNGAMYGALQIAENIHFNGFKETYNEEESPYLRNRGIKFNIPLDKKSPTYYYSTDGTSHKEAICHVWDMSFWQTWFDEMARHRYNVLSLWSPHPFTSMLNMEDEYPGIAIQGVTGYDENGNAMQVNNMTIDEKIAFWQQVMQYGRDRGFGIYFCTWNIFLFTADGKNGLTNSPHNQKTKTYLKKCMKNFLETYPDLAGFGITVGERMGGIDDRQKEEWAWGTYGMGMMEYAQANPDRDLVFIHRQHDGDLDHILENFKPLGELPNVRFDLSFKYSQAHAHTTVTPSRWHKMGMEDGLGPNNLMSWLTIRNDDWYFLHWAEPQFVRDYVNHFPEVDKYVNAFYIGADGWVFTRVFTSKDPYYEDKDALSIQRTWYMQKLWGRISYNPSVSNDLFKNHLALKYPEASSERLFEAWSNASGAIRLANEQVTGSWDLDMDWWPEGWTGDAWNEEEGRFFSLQETRKTTPFNGSHLCSFFKSARKDCGGKVSAWLTADKIDEMASKALKILSTINYGSNTELKLNLKDLEAQANLGLYNAYKFRAAMYLEQDKKDEARDAIGTAYCFWKKYTHLMDVLYRPVDLQRNLNFTSWHDHDEDALQDYLELGGEGEPDCSDRAGVQQTAEIYYDAQEKAIVFAAKDLFNILDKMGTTATLKSLSSLSNEPVGTYFIIAQNNTDLQTRLANAGGKAVGTLGKQDYALRATKSENSAGYWALGGDRIGAMYGGIHIGEILAGGLLANFKDEDQSPYIEKRGLKVNIPLDERTPSFDDGGWAANTNRDDVWDINFWKEYFDVLARQRYNVISLWNRHPFPSLVKVEGFEEISLQGVLHRNGTQINNWSIEEKIEFWNQVLDLAEDRGIEVWPVVWNVELHAADGKCGITRAKGNQPAKEYLRKAVKQLFISYPKLAGIGVTAGEKMDDYTDSEKEQWVWETYGLGVMDAKELFPDRKIRFVHRHWLTDWKEIGSRFSQLPDGFELALKYAQARLYSATNPSWATRQLAGIPKDMATWWNLRNDDIYVQRWGDPEYVRTYILNFPHKSKPCLQSPCLTAGYIMGSDRYFWARESMSKNPQTPRQLENEKHWYKFLLWGRLGYDPNTPKELLRGLIQYRFPTVNAAKVFDAWQAASRIIPMVNRFHFWNWDYFWWVEQGTGNEWSDINGYHNINHIIDNRTQDVSGYTNIKDFVNGDKSGTSPLVVADSLEANAKAALNSLAGLTDSGNIERRETLGDIKSQAHFGLYWAHKIRGGVELERFRNNKKNEHKANAISHLQKALAEWENYAAQLATSYEKAVIAGHHKFDWDAITLDVEKDIEIVRNAE